MKKRLSLTVAMLALAVTGAACGDDAGAAITSTTTTTAPTTTSPPTTAPARLPDGDHFAFLRGFADGSMLLDPAEWLSGEEARLAAVEAGVIAEGEDLPNDYFIRNPDETEVAVPVAASASFTLIVSSDTGLVDTEFGLDDAIAAWQGTLDETIIYGLSPEYFPVLVTVRDGVIVEARQQYVP